jgi:hypothetical protein
MEGSGKLVVVLFSQTKQILKFLLLFPLVSNYCQGLQLGAHLELCSAWMTKFKIISSQTQAFQVQLAL